MKRILILVVTGVFALATMFESSSCVLCAYTSCSADKLASISKPVVVKCRPCCGDRVICEVEACDSPEIESKPQTGCHATLDKVDVLGVGCDCKVLYPEFISIAAERRAGHPESANHAVTTKYSNSAHTDTISKSQDTYASTIHDSISMTVLLL